MLHSNWPKRPRRVTCSSLLFALLIMGLVGCNSVDQSADQATQPTQQPLSELVLLVIGDDALGDTIARQWRSRMDGSMKTQTISVEEMANRNFKIPAEVDLVIYPPAMMGEFASRNEISEIPQNVWSDPEFNKKEILNHPRITNVTYGRSLFAAPLGGPQFSMIYRRDVLEALKIKPPTTWKEFDLVAEKLLQAQTLANDAGPLPTEIDVPLGGSPTQYWAAQSFLARVAPYIRHRGKLSTVFDKETMAPLIDSEPFVRALTEMVESTGKSLADEQLRSPNQIYQRLLDGQSAIGITWPTGAISNSESENGVAIETDNSISEQLAISSLPGTEEWYDQKKGEWIPRDEDEENRVALVGFDGFVISVPKNAPHTVTAYKCLTWLPSKQISLATMTQSQNSGPFRASHLGNPTPWTGSAISADTAKQYGEVIREINDQKVVFVFPRIPGQSRYLAALNSAVIDCVTKGTDPKSALQKTSQQWSAINEELGAAVQLGELRRSENF